MLTALLGIAITVCLGIYFIAVAVQRTIELFKK